ncbi:translation initiation factor eIF-2A [Coprinopsis marcescibilis]|uniref:Eukaryotic translation initiation factor 2A n=1 Tax=Coprinopsis marcescibilis TaxID=230819 RepID=A0A5C3KWM1_COPMA|nr:translation initiation factor eIF-2A [Coprinopsis marcescibilis]
MAAQLSQQYAYRAQKSLGLVGGTPDYQPIPGFESPDAPARTYTYSADGRLYAYALPTVVRIYQAEGGQILQELQLPNIVDLNFSPRGTYLSTWERPGKLEDGAQHKNLRVFSVSTGEELIAFSQKAYDGWQIQYTISESHAVRLVSSEIQVYRPSEWSKGIVDKLKIEGASTVALSPGLNPSVAVFVAEKKGAPASIKVYGLLSLNTAPTCQKTFFKADRAQIKWNTLGTQVLLLTQTEVDNSNKSYYGETGLYLLSAAGNFDCRVTLDKEGPIHDFAWSPNSKEFGVVYGYMPAKSMLFDQRVRTTHDFGLAPYNFISFNPQGRLIALAGFGNLAGKMDIIDRRTLTKVCTIDAPNSSYCEWSPDGRFILTATLSPRLRVDNGVKVWHCSGPLVHVQHTEELYQASWRPLPVDGVPPFPQQVPSAPAPSPSVSEWEALSKKTATPVKPAGAYRPPGARGLATPSIFKREDEGGVPGGGNAAGRYGAGRGGPVPGAPGYGASNGHNGRSRIVPGAPPPGSGPEAAKGNRKRKGGKRETDQEPGSSPPGLDVAAANGDLSNGNIHSRGGKGRNRGQPSNANSTANSTANSAVTTPQPPSTPVPPPVEPETPLTSALDSAALDAVAKKARNLNKKLKAIEELKEKQKRGERLEATQIKKIDGEEEIRRELATLNVASL